MRCGFVTIFLFAIASSAIAQEHVELGDAPALLPGQEIFGPVTTISGIFDDDADTYKIQIIDKDLFSATTVDQPGSLQDTQLFLFDASGHGVTHNDDQEATVFLGSTLTGQFVPENGIYYISITGWDLDPTAPNGFYIWNDDPADVERQPDGLGASGQLAGWQRSIFGGQSFFGSYTIRFPPGAVVGTASCSPPRTEDGDLNGDGSVDLADYAIMQAHFGESCPANAPALPVLDNSSEDTSEIQENEAIVPARTELE